MAIAAATVVLGPALAQTQDSLQLRGALDATAPAPGVRGLVSLPPPPVTLNKPTSVRRIRSAEPPMLRDVVPDPNAPVQPVSTGDGAASAPIGPPTLEPEIPVRRPRRPVEEDPYAPLGLRAGTFMLRPSIDVDFGYSDNPGFASGKVKGATFVLVKPRLEFNSDWDRHELRGSIDGSYTNYFGQTDENRPKLNALLSGRFDVQRDTAIEAETRFVLDSLRQDDPNAPPGATTRPITLAYGATLGVVQQFGRTSLRLRGAIDRNTTQDDPTSDYDTYGVALRGTYDLSPAVRPFLEVALDQRRHDVDTPRDSDGLTGLAGVTLDLNGTFTGEAAVGYESRRYRGPGFSDLSGLLVDASLVWRPTVLTTVTFKASSNLGETTLAGSSGTINHTYGVEVSHALRRYLIAKAAVSQQISDYVGTPRTDRTFDAALGLEYKLSRTFAVKATYAYERLTSTIPSSDYTANSLMVGLRMQY